MVMIARHLIWINDILSCGFETSCKKSNPGHNPAIDMWGLVVLECSRGSWGRAGEEGSESVNLKRRGCLSLN